MGRNLNKAQVGKLGENEALSYLKKKGYKILHCNWRSGKDEIDIVALHNDILVIVEVKTRTSISYGEPWEAVDERKQQALERAAMAYLDEFSIDMELRFDIVSIVLLSNNEIQINHIENAFYP